MGAGQTRSDTSAERLQIADGHIRELVDGMRSVLWRTAESFDTATPTTDMVERVEEALAEHGMDRVQDVVLVRHRPGQHGLPHPLAEAPSGFAIDLTDAESGAEGGVLLFLDETGQGRGWRSEAGALTVWSRHAPLLTELTARAPERVTLFGLASPMSAEI